jgi:hypothetical protein
LTNANGGLYNFNNFWPDCGEANSYLDPDEVNSFPSILYALLDEAGEPISTKIKAVILSNPVFARL